MILKFQQLKGGVVLPERAHPTDAGLDLTAVSCQSSDHYGYYEYGTGWAVEIPEGYAGLLMPRSSITKYNLSLANGVGCVDASYRGEIKLRFNKLDKHWLPIYEIGDRIGQLVIIPVALPVVEIVQELSVTERGEGGFGSTN